MSVNKNFDEFNLDPESKYMGGMFSSAIQVHDEIQLSFGETKQGAVNAFPAPFNTIQHIVTASAGVYHAVDAAGGLVAILPFSTMQMLCADGVEVDPKAQHAILSSLLRTMTFSVGRWVEISTVNEPAFSSSGTVEMNPALYPRP